MVRILSISFISIFLIACAAAPQTSSRLTHDPSAEYPFGRKNPAAPSELSQFSFLIGRNDCQEERLNNTSGEWVTGTRNWDAHYYLDGFAIVDFGTASGGTNGNIRIYDTATDQWQVSFFSTPVYGTGTWSGGLVEDRIELERPQMAPGTNIEGVNRLTFYNISDTEFNWKGEWVSLDGNNIFPFWRIHCSKVT